MTVDRPDLNGLRIRLPGHAAVYLIDQGKRRWIPNPTVYDDLFRTWEGILQDVDVKEINKGDKIPETAILVKTYDNPAVYLLDGVSPNQVRRWVVNPATMDRYQFAWNRIHVWNIPHSSLETMIKAGPEIRNPDTTTPF